MLSGLSFSVDAFRRHSVESVIVAQGAPLAQDSVRMNVSIYRLSFPFAARKSLNISALDTISPWSSNDSSPDVIGDLYDSGAAARTALWCTFNSVGRI